MTIGTRSLLYGAHCFFVHPWFVALGWWKLYGFPLDPRLWVAFVIHDWGYAGCSKMDGETDGELHPYWAALRMHKWFDAPAGPDQLRFSGYWYDMLAYHSRFLAKRAGVEPSLLCWADKLAFSLQPWWIYLPLARLTGELSEYMGDAVVRYGTASPVNARHWHRTAAAKMARVAYDGAAAHYRAIDQQLNPAPGATTLRGPVQCEHCDNWTTAVGPCRVCGVPVGTPVPVRFDH